MREKFLIVKINGIGDVIMALAMLREIREIYKDSDITWITGKAGAEILKHFNVNNVVVADEKAILNGSIYQKIRAVFDVWKKIAGKSFTKIYIPYRDKRYRLLVLPAFAGQIKMFGKGGDNRLIPIPGRKFIDEYARFVTEKEGCDMQAKESVSIDLKEYENPNPGMNNYIVLSPGGFKNIQENPLAVRQWPITYYKALAERLLEAGFSVVITGNESESWISEEFKGISVINMIGKLSIRELLTIYRDAYCVVTHDSGSLHMAGLAGSRIVSLFGPTNPNVFVPRSSREVCYIWHQEQYACCPCYDGVRMAACKDNVCMQSITVDEVYARIGDTLHENGNRKCGK